jgi:hypothetical protein
MASIRICYFVVFFCFLITGKGFSQTIYYPSNSSQLLKATATDMSILLQNSIAGSHFTTQEYNNILPESGIILLYDSTVSDNQACNVLGNGSNFIKLYAAEDNGLIFGIYQYLFELGFKFYQPGSIWEIIPSNTSAFRKLEKQYNTPFKYKYWFISGGHRIWLMDKSTEFGGEIYSGENGHNWGLYQRRNGMLGGYRFTGHRGDIVNGTYLDTLNNNPCYVASYNNSRQATSSSVPDVTNPAAIQLWAKTIEQKYTTYRNNIFNHKVTYVNLYRSFIYNSQNVGIEVPDGPRWGNSKGLESSCLSDYESPSDQNIKLANQTAKKIKLVYPEKRFQLYAYASHANIPSSQLSIDSSIDVQVISTAFQNEVSSKGLLNRWYNKYSKISEYHYLNIPQWSGETPSVYLNTLKQTVERLYEKNSQGITWEASPAKFTSLPFLKAANEYLINGNPVDSSLKEFCNNMFGNASNTIYDLMQQWSSDGALTMGYFFKDNKYKIPGYLQLLQKAVQEAGTGDTLVLKRLQELKAYLHYVVLYYDWAYDYRNSIDKADKAAAICVYLAKINKLQLVNSYYLITGFVNAFESGSNFYNSYNVFTGTAYLNGSLPLISSAEIESNFFLDMSQVATVVQGYELNSDIEVAAKISGSNFTPAGKINVTIGYTNGADYSNKSVFNIYAKSKGSFTIRYYPGFNMPEKGYINFSVENQYKALQVIKDVTLNATAVDGELTVDLPEAGYYSLSVISKYKSVVRLEILTNGNAFYKNTAFTHRYAERYNSDMASLPGYFYVPHGMQRVYFSVNNSYIVNKGYLTEAQVSSQFMIKDGDGIRVNPVRASNNDSTLFYLEIPAQKSGKFWQISNMGQFFICFANISNILWYGNKQGCLGSAFDITIVKKGDECLTKLTALTNATNLRWEVYDAGNILKYNNLKEVLLPNSISPNASVTLFISDNCSTQKKLSDTKNYFQIREACASGATIPGPSTVIKPVLYPNPSSGLYKINMGDPLLKPENTTISDVSGRKLLVVNNTSILDLSRLPSGVYWYQIESNAQYYKGKIIKN